MNSFGYMDLSSNEETEVQGVKGVRPDFLINTTNNQPCIEEHAIIQGFCGNESSTGLLNSSWATDLKKFYANEFPHAPALPSAVPLCRQFWKAGEYEAGLPTKPISQNGRNHLRVHPKFLHSNATSHKWAFGAIAELLDNAVDEVRSGATFVIIDKITDPRNGNHALLIQDDGGGMDPESIRRCMSFGFSGKQSDSSIGQYGNGFKTSTMRLGADVIVFSRSMYRRNLMQSVGLLSYTFLMQSGCDDIIVPMVDYELDPSTGVFKALLRHGQKQFYSNLSAILRWSPFTTEAELLTQFSDLGLHGTKVVVFNLWYNDSGNMELDFDTDAEDIMISGARRTLQTNRTATTLKENHIANRFRYSLRVYSSFLYLHLPENFMIILRGRVVDPHHIVDDLKFCQCIKYNPQVGGKIQPAIITTIGFFKDAPNLSIHGFNVYHRNRLILPFWPVWGNESDKCRGVAGVLEVNFMEPTHDKQDFERSSLYVKLETRLKEMALEYWDYHCHLVGYKAKKLPSKMQSATVASDHRSSHLGTLSEVQQVMLTSNQLPFSETHSDVRPVMEAPGPSIVSISGAAYITGSSENAGSNPPHLSAIRQQSSSPMQTFTKINTQTELPKKRRRGSNIDAMESLQAPDGAGEIAAELGTSGKNQLECSSRRKQIREQLKILIHENKKLKTQCSDLEKTEEQLLLKEQKLKDELQKVKHMHEDLLVALMSMDEINKVKL